MDGKRCFSIRSVGAAPESDGNKRLLGDMLRERRSNFVNTDYLF